MAEPSTSTTAPKSPSYPNRHRAPTNPTSPPSKRTKPSTTTDPSPLQAPQSMSTPKPGPYPPGLFLDLDEDMHGPRSSTSLPPAVVNAAIHEAAAETIPLQIKKLRPEAKVPVRGSKYSAGYDIFVCEDATVPKWGKAMLSTGIAVAIPPGTYGRIAPRSGLASKHSIATGAGVIDYDYRGEVKVLLFNHSDQDFPVKAGDRMAQLVLERIVNPEVVVVEELDGTERGEGGFGSTGGFGVVGQMVTGKGSAAGTSETQSASVGGV